MINRRELNTGIAARRRNKAQFFVLDQAYRLRIGDVEGTALFSPEILSTVRSMTRHWTDDISTHTEEIGLASHSLVLRVFPLQGKTGWAIGVYVEPYRRRSSLAERAELFGLKPTQYELIRLLTEGRTAAEAALMSALPLGEFDASMFEIIYKVGVKNTDELLAKVAGKRP